MVEHSPSRISRISPHIKCIFMLNSNQIHLHIELDMFPHCRYPQVDGYGGALSLSHPSNLSARPRSFGVILIRGKSMSLKYEPSTLNPNPETRNPKPETRNPRPETRNPKPETRNPKPETRNPKHETRNTKHETRNTKHETRNTKSETRNPKPETRNPKP